MSRRKLGGATGEDFWADRPVPHRGEPGETGSEAGWNSPSSPDAAAAPEHPAAAPRPDSSAKPSRHRRKTIESDGQRQSLGRWLKEIALLGVIAIGAAILLTTFVAQAFFIPSASMEATLMINDRVLVNKTAYRFSEPRYRDIIVFASPENTTAPTPATSYGRFMDRLAVGIGLKSSRQDLIKRVIATGGQTVEARVGQVFVDGRQLVEPYRKTDEPIQDFGPLRVPRNRVFVMGDNRLESKDSRSPDIGAIAESSIIGKASALVWPVDRIRRIR